MKQKLSLMVVLGLLLSLVSGLATAGPNANSKILLNVRTTTQANNHPCTDPAASPSSCAAISTNGKLIGPNAPGQYIYLLVEEANGVSSMDCGINFTGTGQSFFSWNLCADNDTTTTGWQTGGNRITWDTCQTGPVICAGYFYCGVYSPCQLLVVGDPVNGLAVVTACDTTQVDNITGHDVSHMGYVNFSAGAVTPGYNPCGLVTPTSITTWGAIKSTFR